MGKGGKGNDKSLWNKGIGVNEGVGWGMGWEGGEVR